MGFSSQQQAIFTSLAVLKQNRNHKRWCNWHLTTTYVDDVMYMHVSHVVGYFWRTLQHRTMSLRDSRMLNFQYLQTPRLLLAPPASQTDRKLSKEEELLRERRRLDTTGITSYALHADTDTLLFLCGDDLYWLRVQPPTAGELRICWESHGDDVETQITGENCIYIVACVEGCAPRNAESTNLILCSPEFGHVFD